MKIKIPPFPNFTLQENFYDSLAKHIGVKKISHKEIGTNNNWVGGIKFKNGDERLIRLISLEKSDQFYISALPNPIHLFLDAAIFNFEQSETISKTSFPTCSKNVNDNVNFLDFESGDTHDCFTQFMKFRTSSIIMLVSSIEAFLNYAIPVDYEYSTIRKNKEVIFNKNDIESPKVSFNEKLTKVLPSALGMPEFWNTYGQEQQAINMLYRNRKNIVHLKTESEEDMSMYYGFYQEMLSLDLMESIQATIRFYNAAKPNFIESK